MEKRAGGEPFSRHVSDFLFLYLTSPLHQHAAISFANLSITPAVQSGNFKIFYRGGHPIIGVTWAWVSEAVDERLLNGGYIRPHEWNSGPHFWLLEVVAPFGRGSVPFVKKWLETNLPEDLSKFRYARLSATERFQPRFFVEVSRIAEGGWRRKIIRHATVATEIPEFAFRPCKYPAN